MGKELRITYQHFNEADLEEFILSRFGAHYNAEESSWHINAPGIVLPALTISLEANSLAFCDNLVSEKISALVFYELVQYLLSKSTEININEP
ncbi:hypothetical protein [Hymenobacter sp. GOD-10R]|uniref:hypothetical protein n=1 Tax=Hymenobacter sp. GOD-10R TaxID=3093922 RepID=UPI002D77573B|nr:hypothetical protein [Hymenobacter sp. GOD-10R]WRQ30800.1 hypothetical protein SD425_11055 [Hymenobacter sp. GOD-10R]